MKTETVISLTIMGLFVLLWCAWFGPLIYQRGYDFALQDAHAWVWVENDKEMRVINPQGTESYRITSTKPMKLQSYKNGKLYDI